MDGNRVLIGFLIFVVAFLALPVVVKVAKGENTANAAVVATNNVPVPPAPGGKPGLPTELSQPPLLNEANLINSEWQFFYERYKMKLVLTSGGVAYVTSPFIGMLTGKDYIEGRWRVEYDKLYVATALAGKEYNYTFKISGMKAFLMKPDGSLGELERFR